MLPGTVGRLLTVAMFAHLASGQGAETTVPNCANRRIQYLTDAEYNTNVAPFIMADIEYMCGEGCNDPAVEECRSYTTVSANTMMQISLDWPRKPENPGPADCVGAFKSIVTQCLEGAKNQVNTGRGDNVIGGAYIAISFSHHEQTEHVPAPDELDGSDPQPPNEDLPGSFYIADYIEKVDDQEVGSGLVIHGASSPPNCEAVARNLDNIKAEITGYNPYIEDENIRRHPRLFLQDQNSFHVGGVKDGKICGIPITFQLTKSIIDGGYALKESFRPLGMCQVMGDTEVQSCFIPKGDGLTIEYKPLMSCYATSAPNYCLSYGTT